MVGDACLPSNAYFPWTPDYTLSFRVHVCSSEHPSLLYGLGTLTTDFVLNTKQETLNVFRIPYICASCPDCKLSHVYLLKFLCSFRKISKPVRVLITNLS